MKFFSLQTKTNKYFKQRILMVLFFIFFCFLFIFIKLFFLTKDGYLFETNQKQEEEKKRYNILDRNGTILATSLSTTSLYINPKHILDLNEDYKKIKTLFPNEKNLYKKLSQKNKSFIWLARHVTPVILQKFYELGIPGIYAKKDMKRLYLFNNLFSHIIGFCNLDGKGLSGIEGFLSHDLEKKDLYLSVDARVQYILREELRKGIKEFNATAGNAIIMNRLGEIVAMVSLPDFNPNLRNKKYTPECFFNRNTLGSYEPGSTLKILNIAIALSEKTAELDTVYDARYPIQIGKFQIKDFKGKNKFLNFKEGFIYSSNIVQVKIAEQFGPKIQKEYFKTFNLYHPLALELFEKSASKNPKKWNKTNMMSAAYGYGIALTPINLLSTINGICMDGIWKEPTLILNKHSYQKRIVSKNVSDTIKKLMHLVTTEGTGRKAKTEVCPIFGKTGTVYINKNGNYLKGKNKITTFIGGFPYPDPEYTILLMLEDPKPTKDSFSFSTAGWNVAPLAKRIIEHIVLMFNVNSKN